MGIWRPLSPHLAMNLVLLAMLAVPAACFAQFEFEDGGIAGLLGGNDDNPVTVSAQFTPKSDDKPAVLMVTADMAPNWHIYPLQNTGSIGLPTKIKLEESPEFRVIGSFAEFPKPVVHQRDTGAGKLADVSEHAGRATFYAPIEFTAGADPKNVSIGGTIDYLVCKDDGSCVPGNQSFTAQLGEGVPIGPLSLKQSDSSSTKKSPANSAAPPPLKGPITKGVFRAERSQVSWSGWLEPAQVTPGGNTTLYVKAQPAPGWHLYARGDQVPKLGNKPTLLVMTHASGLEVFAPQTDADIISKDRSDIGFGIVRHHEGDVTWKIPIHVPDSTDLGKLTLAGILAYQACESTEDGTGSCEIPAAARFQVPVEVVKTFEEESSQPISFAPANYSEAAAALDQSTPRAGSPPNPAGRSQLSAGTGYDLSKIKTKQAERPLLLYLSLAFIGGLILNLMPCVLPVIGLKVMSFVDQAGHSRAKALRLNLWYAAGIVSVFLVLAAIAATTASFSWGAQSSSTLFNVLLVALVFAMALSLLGVWEIPIPGFIGSGSVHEVASKEGAVGAYLKGIVTTILAIPCTGPFMATALGWAVRQPPFTIFQVFAAMGIGMASPYVVVGVYPRLLKFLPKPGMWMETFKQLMGFVLLATVVFILSYMETAALVPTAALLAGIALACWVYARTSPTADFNDRVQTWALSGAIAAGSALLAFGWLYRDVMQPREKERVAMQVAKVVDQRTRMLEEELNGVTDVADITPAIRRFEAKVAAESQGPWQPFSLENLGQVAVDEGRTVLVDFSAEWCLTCKALEKTVLHTEPVEQAIAAGNVVTMYADFTNQPPELAKTIRALGGNGVPVIAIFPGNDPYNPIVFLDGYKQSMIIEALEKATGRKLVGQAVAMQANSGVGNQ